MAKDIKTWRKNEPLMRDRDEKTFWWWLIDQIKEADIGDKEERG
jgi:hypothetical protein